MMSQQHTKVDLYVNVKEDQVSQIIDHVAPSLKNIRDGFHVLIFGCGVGLGLYGMGISIFNLRKMFFCRK